MKILVTGANGYIGSKVVIKLLNMGHTVIATDINNNHIDSRAIYISSNIFVPKENYFVFFNKPDVCLHMAWRDGFVHNSFSHMEDLSKHFSFLKNMVDNGLKHLVVMGTMHEVGYWEGQIDEKTPCNPKTYYGIAKNSLRQALENLCITNNVVFQWLRGFYIYGDDSFGNSVFCKLRNAAEKGEKTFPFTTGKNKFDFLHIDDLTTQIVLSSIQTKVTGIINVCSGKAEPLGEKLEWYIKNNNLDISLDYGKYKERQTESPCIYGKDDKIKEIMALKNRKILVTGVNGQLGYDCMKELSKRGYTNVVGVDKDDLDITDEISVKEYIYNYKPEIVIHNAAWTAVDKGELMPEEVFAVNSYGPKYIAEACKEVDATMIQISTDYVFDGKGIEPFEIDSPKNGLSVYGKSKALAEDFVSTILKKYFIIRITGAFGVNGNNFVKTMIKLAKSGKKELNVVCDQIVSLTYTEDLSTLICDMIETNKYGIYHATNEGFASWAEIADEIFKIANYDVKVNYVTTEQYRKIVTNQAERPLNSRLSKKSLVNAGFHLLPDWKNALNRYLEEIL